MIPVIDRNYDANDALTANIHVVIPVIDQNYDINDVVTANEGKGKRLIVLNFVFIYNIHFYTKNL